MENIKFRAWEPNEKRYLTWEELQESTVQDVFRVFKLQQFTGLVDMNGREIYEGDILLDPSEPETFGMVGWMKDGTWSFWVFNEDAKDFSDGWFECLTSDVNSYCHIIGNNYENPNILAESV